MHKFGKLSLFPGANNIDKKLLKKDLSNINPYRKVTFFPQYV